MKREVSTLTFLNILLWMKMSKAKCLIEYELERLLEANTPQFLEWALLIVFVLHSIHKRLHKHTHKLTTRLYTSSYIPFRRFQFCFGTHDRSTINCQYMSLYKEFYVYKCVSILYLNFKMKTTKKNACATYIIRISISFANCINHILFFISWWEINTFSFAKKIYIWTKQNQ